MQERHKGEPGPEALKKSALAERWPGKIETSKSKREIRNSRETNARQRNDSFIFLPLVFPLSLSLSIPFSPFFHRNEIPLIHNSDAEMRQSAGGWVFAKAGEGEKNPPTIHERGKEKKHVRMCAHPHTLLRRKRERARMERCYCVSRRMRTAAS
ncbi:hypothetical protein ACS0PU_001355 [Formica fusca]